MIPAFVLLLPSTSPKAITRLYFRTTSKENITEHPIQKSRQPPHRASAHSPSSLSLSSLLTNTIFGGGHNNNNNINNKKFLFDHDPDDSDDEDNGKYRLLTLSAIGAPFAAYLVSARIRRSSPFGFERKLYISHIILAINVIIFIYQSAFAPSLLMAGAKINSAIAAGQYYRLLSPMFLHASTTHLLVNSFSLSSTGPSVESWFGKRRFLFLYVISGLGGNYLSYLCSPSPAVGASGAIFGLVGATAVMLGRHKRLLGGRARRGLQSLVYIVISNFALGLTPGSRIDNYGHLGGFLAGIAFSYIFGPNLKVHQNRGGRSAVYDEPIFSQVRLDFQRRFNQIYRLLKP